MFRTDESDLEELGKTANVLKDIVNIDVKGANGINSFGDILGEIAKKWNTLSEQEQLALAQQIGGTHHYSKFIGLMNNYQIALDATSMAYNSQNSAMQENQKYMDSLAGRIGLFKNAWESMMNSFIQSDTLKGLVDLGTALLPLLENIGLVNIGLTALILKFGLSGKIVAVFPALFQRLAISMLSIGKATVVTANSLKIASIALSTFIPIAIIVGITGLIYLIDEMNVSLKEQSQIVADLRDTIASLQSEYDNLASKANRTDEEEKYLAILKEQLRLQKEQLSLQTQLKIKKEYGSLVDPNSGKTSTSAPVYKNSKTNTAVTNRFGLPTNSVDVKNEVDKSVENLEKYRQALDEVDETKTDAFATSSKLRENINKETLSLLNKRTELTNDKKSMEDMNDTDNEAYQIVVAKLAIIDKVVGQQAILNGIISKYSGITDDASKSLSQLNTEYDLLNKAQKEMSDNGYLSQETIDLLDASFSDFTSTTQLSKDAIIKFVATHKEAVRVEMKNEIAKTDNLIAESNTRIQKMKDELIALNAVNGAYGRIYDKLVEKAKSGAELSKFEENVLNNGLGRYKKESLNDEINLLGELITKRNKLEGNLASFDKRDDKADGKEKAIPELKDAVQREDLTTETIKSYNAQVDLVDKKIEELEAQLKLNDETKDFNEEVRITNQLIQAQIEKHNALQKAKEKIASEEERLKALEVNKDFKPNTWFDANGEASLAYKDYLNTFNTLSEEVRKKTNVNSKESVENSNKEIEKLESKKKLAIELFNNIYALKKAWEVNTDAIQNSDEAILEFKKSIIDLTQTNLDNQINAVKDVQDTLMAIQKAKFEKDKQLENDLHDLYIKHIDDKIKKLDEQHKAESYDRDVTKTDKEINNKQAEINALALDNSVEGMAKKAELQQELDDLLMQKEDDRLDHQYESEKDTLENLKDLENDRHDAQIDALDLLMDDITVFNSTQKDLTELTMNQIIDKYKIMSKEVGGIYASLTSQAKLYNEVALGKAIISNPDSAYNTQGNTVSSSDIGSIIKVVEQIIALKQQWTTSDDGTLAKQADSLRATLPPEIASAVGADKTLAEANAELARLKKLKQYKNGGLADYTGLAWVDGTKTEPEGFLKSKDLEMLLEALDISKKIMPLVTSVKTIDGNRFQKQTTMQNHFDLKVYASEGQSPLEIAKIAEKFIWDNLSRKLSLDGIN